MPHATLPSPDSQPVRRDPRRPAEDGRPASSGPFPPEPPSHPLRSAAEDLAATKQRLKLALAATGLGSWELDRRTGMRLGSARMAEIAGIQPQDMAAPGFDWFDLVHPEDRSAVLAVYFNNRGDNRLVQHQYRLRHAQGHDVWIDACLQVLARDAHGVAQHMVGTVADITERRRHELRREQQRQLLDLLNQAQASFLVSHDLQLACRTLLAPLLVLTGCDLGLIGVLQGGDDGHTELALPAVAQRDGPAPDCLPAVGLDNLLGRMLQQDEARLHTADALVPLAQALGLPVLDALVGLPLRFGGRVVGLVALGLTRQPAGSPATAAAPVLGDVAELLTPLLGSLGALVHARELDQARRRAEALLLHQASTDALTGLANRGHFMQAAQAAMAMARRSTQPLTAVVVDLDHFKRINDTHGHSAGDEVLRRFAALARPLVRGSDLVGRLGGEEFGILLRDTPAAQALLIVDRLRQALADSRIDVGTAQLRVTLSAGVAGWPGEGCGVDAWLALADRSLYAAKHAGRNQVVCA